MAKSTDQANNRTAGVAIRDFAEIPSSAEDADFLENLNQKEAVALSLSKELAMWFGNDSRPSSFRSTLHP